MLAVLCGLFAITAAHGVRISLSRRVHDVFSCPSFEEKLTIPGMQVVKWADSTKVRPDDARVVHAGDLEGIVKFLREREGNFFIFPDFTIVYGLVGRHSKQPLLWFHRGLTYPNEYSDELDQRLVASLEESHIEFVVMENPSGRANRVILSHFPLLKAYIERHFCAGPRFGVFHVLERREVGETIVD